MEEKLKIKVTKIGSLWHARLSEDNRVISEYACECKEDIGWICREMLRWFDKLGGISKFASAARSRQIGAPRGRVWRDVFKSGKRR